MAQKFDVTLKSLLEDAPADWPALAGVPSADVAVIDADIATISGAADKVLLIRDAVPFIMHFEFQTGPDASLPRRMNVYNSVLEDRHDLPVISVAVLLAPQANLSAISGNYQRQAPGEVEPYRVFRYRVIRVWQVSVDRLLQGGLACLALAPISAVRPDELPGVLQTMKRRLSAIPDQARRGRLWTATYVLMGMRYETALVEQLLQGVVGMKESVTYQAIVAEGVAEGLTKGALKEARKIVLRLGNDRFGVVAPSSVRAHLEQSSDLAQLEELTSRILRCRSWDELLSEPRKTQRRKPKS